VICCYLNIAGGKEKINDEGNLFNLEAVFSWRIFLVEKKREKSSFVSRELQRQLAVNDRPKNFGKNHGICRKLENRTVGKSHEWPCNVNEAPVTQFC